MIEAKKEDVKIKTSEKWRYYKPIHLRYMLTIYHRLPRRRIYDKMVMNKRGNRQINQS